MIVIPDAVQMVSECVPGGLGRVACSPKRHCEAKDRFPALNFARCRQARARECGGFGQAFEEINCFPFLLERRELTITPGVRLEQLPRGIINDSGARKLNKVRNFSRLGLPGSYKPRGRQ